MNESDSQSLAQATKQFNESTAKVRRELFDPPIADLTVERLREGFRLSAKMYRQQGKKQVADALLKIAETDRLPENSSGLVGTGPIVPDQKGNTLTRQVVPGLTLSDPTVSSNFSLIVLRPLELIYRKEGRTSKGYGDQFDLEKGRMLEEEELKQKEVDRQSFFDYWKQTIGMEFGEIVELNTSKTPHLGGVRIKTVQKESRADQAGIRSGDILIGIHVWDTKSIKNLTFIHQRIIKGALPNPAKLYVLSKSETLYTKMEFPINLGVDGK